MLVTDQICDEWISDDNTNKQLGDIYHLNSWV